MMYTDPHKHAIVSGLAERYYDRVMCFARQLTDAHTAEDVVQDVFLRLSKLEGLENREINVSYLIKIAHNLIKGRARKASVVVNDDIVAGASAESSAVLPGKPNPTSLGAAVDMDRLTESLHLLTINEQSAIRLTVCRGLSLRQASVALGVKVSTVTNWKYRGLRKLAEHQGTLAA